MNKPTKEILRGLEWIHSQATADFEAASGEPGQFPGTSESEVARALEWLQSTITNGRGYAKEMTMTEVETINVKLSIFHSILSHRHDLPPTQAADEAEAVYQKLCVPQAPSA